MNKFNMYFAIMVLLLVGTVTYAQAPNNPDASADAVPVDGGITALLIGGAVYGAKKLRDRKNQK